jgi:hypothetical protein
MMENQTGRGPKMARAWARWAVQLAVWTMQNLVVRTDRYGGQYLDPEGVIQRTTPHELTRRLIERHFAAGVGARTEDIIGLHNTGLDKTCGWAAVDVDRHYESIDPVANRRYAKRVLRRALRAGFAALLVDSSGGTGGFHVFILFAEPVPVAEAFRLVRYLARGHGRFGLPKPPDLFPRSREPGGLGLGCWLRLFGRHHKRPVWARIWCPERRRWLEGEAAVKAILRLRGQPVDVSAVVPAGFGVEPPRARAAAAADPRRDEPAHRREVRRARAALDHLVINAPGLADDYDPWLRVGMALKELEPDGLELWHEWSSSSLKYEPDVLDAKWQGFREADVVNGVSLGTLYHLAAEAGWDPSWVDGDDWCSVTRRRGAGRRALVVKLKRRGVGPAGGGANG